MSGDPDHAVLAQENGDPSEGAGVRRDRVIDAVEDPGYRRGDRTRFGQVETARLAIRIIAEVDLDLGAIGVDRQGDGDSHPVGHAWIRWCGH